MNVIDCDGSDGGDNNNDDDDDDTVDLNANPSASGKEHIMAEMEASDKDDILSCLFMVFVVCSVCCLYLSII